MNKKIISLEIPEDLKEALRAEAFIQNMTISALIRKILKENIPPVNSLALKKEISKNDR